MVVAESNDYGQCTLSFVWEDIIAVYSGNFHAVGLKSDGTVVASGSSHSG